MDHDEILQKVIEIVADTLSVDADELGEKSTFDDLGADSFDKLSLVTAFEDEFGFTLDDDVLQEIESVGDAVAAIEKAQ